MYLLAYLSSIALKVVKIDNNNNCSVFYSIKVVTFQNPVFYFNTQQEEKVFFSACSILQSTQ